MQTNGYYTVFLTIYKTYLHSVNITIQSITIQRESYILQVFTHINVNKTAVSYTSQSPPPDLDYYIIISSGIIPQHVLLVLTVLSPFLMMLRCYNNHSSL